MSVLAYDGPLDAGVDGEDVLVDELHRPGTVGELDVEVIGQARPFQLQLRGLQAGLRTCLCIGEHGDGGHVKGPLVYPSRCDVEPF